MSETKSDLSILYPGEDVQAKGETVRVEPFYSLQLEGAAKRAKPMLVTLMGSGLVRLDGEKLLLADDWPIKLIDSAEEGISQLIEFVRFALNKPIEWFERLPPDELIDLTEAVCRQNVDFFKKRILPKLRAWMPAAPEPVGAPSLPDSSPTDTPEPKSTE